MILAVIGSTRPNRIGDQLADHIVPRIEQGSGQAVEVVDLRALALPLLDEPKQPSDGDYLHEHTKSWSEQVSTADAVVVITPQYNGGYPAAVKNAIDFLYAEWRDKPVLVVSYGSKGGPGSNAQLSEVLNYIHADVVTDGVRIVIPGSDYGPDHRLRHPADHVAAADGALIRAARALAEKIPSHQPDER